MEELSDDDFEITVVRMLGNRDAVQCDRRTVLGNPFIMRSEPDRDEVCDKFEEYFNEKLHSGDLEFTNFLCGLIETTIDQGYIKLGCHCAPKRCHLDTVKRFLDSVLN